MKYLIAVAVLLLSGCNAVSGLGKDITLVADGVGREMSRQYQE